MPSPLESFHPAVARFFERALGAPTAAQARGWPAIQARRHTLIAAPTGSGKTLAAFLAALDELVREGVEGPLPDETRVVYVSPLKALSNDIEKNLAEPLAGIRAELEALGLPDVNVRVQVRTGDTPARDRAAMTRRPPHVFVTTPESLYILLTSEGGRRMLGTARTVIVDEIHALAGDKRGSHLSLSLERLAALVPGPLSRIGLSATQKPIEEMARFLVGAAAVRPDGTPDCAIVDEGHVRERDLALELPRSPLEAVMSGEVREEVHDRLAELVRAHRTTLVFVNTRREAERVAGKLGERLGPELVAAHHGSLSRDRRLAAEARLKRGELKVLVATASLELGIDIGSVELVCQLGSTRSIASWLQRVGRSGHNLGGTPKGRIFPTSRDDLVECAALLWAVRSGELERLRIPEAPLDILAQQLVAQAACEDLSEDELFARVRRAWPYRNLSRADFDAVIRMLADGFTTRRGRRSAWLHRDLVNRRVRGRRGARLTAMTCGGAIPDTADYEVLLEPEGSRVGTVNEDFAVESMAGDIFQLGNTSWKILRVEPGRVRVEDARGQPPTLPFWLGEAPGRSGELSGRVSALRAGVDRALGDELDVARARAFLEGEPGMSPEGAAQVVEYLGAARAALGALPTAETLILERFFDESGGMQLVFHAPLGTRLNRALGLALRKTFCRRFNFELQAAATDDAVILSLGPTHSFPLEDAFRFLHAQTARHLLTQALLDAPMFETRWRWNAGRALAIPRQRGGKRTPPPLLRMQAADLLTLIFPDQAACAENLAGERELPDHPLVNETLRDCLTEAMDVDGLEALLRAMASGEKRLLARELTEPSPLAAQVLSARPYAFLDDAPLEERRTQAVISRRWMDPQSASELGELDLAAIERVRAEAWPEVTGPDELHDALSLLGFLTEEEGARGNDGQEGAGAGAAAVLEAPAGGWQAHLASLAAARRATVLTTAAGLRLWVAAERLPELAAVHPAAVLAPRIVPPAELDRVVEPEAALLSLVRGRLEASGPIVAPALAAALGVRAGAVVSALARLEAEGFVLRGRFTPGLPAGELEWCERRLLARIHRATLDRLRKEIEPSPVATFLRFLLRWQRLAPGRQAEGAAGLAAVLEGLEGFGAAAAAWEGELLPSRVAEYEPSWLDSLCFAGKVAWSAASTRRGVRSLGPVRGTPLTLIARRHLSVWAAATAGSEPEEEPALSSEAAVALGCLRTRGACFFDELLDGTGLLRSRLESALGELVAAGLVTSDSFAGLRALLLPSSERPDGSAGARARARRRGGPVAGMDSAGRWALLGRPSAPERAEAVEHVARVLLRRYGVVFRRLLEREDHLPPWRELVAVYRRLEARGELRGGRFVAGPTGEQWALPEAVGALRAVRKEAPDGTLISVSAADPLNLVGILTPGARLPAVARNRLLFRDGVPLAVQEAGKVRFLAELEPAAAWEAERTLLRRTVPPGLRVWLGRSA